MQLIRGLDMRLTHTKPVTISQTTFNSMFGSGKIGPVPFLFVWSLVVVIIGHIVLRYTTFGRQVLATGGNPVAARYSGVPVDRIKMYCFLLSGAAGALAGLLYSGMMQTARYTFGTGAELAAIAAVILGGTSLFGGKATVIGTFIGALLIGTINYGLIILGLDVSEQMMISGGLIILAVAFGRCPSKTSEVGEIMPAKSTAKEKSHYSVLIIGAGINGCGTFRDLCLQGIDCLLVDRVDVCSGASAAPSRLIHGGIKYLETREFRLVRESAMERNRLLNNAPHYVKALEVVFPAKSWFAGLQDAVLGYLGFKARIKERGALLVEIGLQIYDFYNRKVKALPDHRFFTKRKLREEFPAVTHEAVAAGLYYEGRVTHAERLGLELVLDGLAAQPQSALRTYTEVEDKPQGGTFKLKDLVTGEIRSVTADVVINASGAWIDKVNDSLGITSSYMGGSRGAHLIVKHEGLLQATQGRMMYFGCKDGRFNLLYPFFGNVLLGSTDLAQQDPDLVHCSAEETDYLLSVVSEIFPDIKLTRDDVILTYSGVRPLPRANGKDIGDVSRDHSIGQDTLPQTNVPVLSLIGGKWTTFRAFSEQSCDAVLSLLDKPRVVSTTDMPIGGGRDYPRDENSRNVMSNRIGARGDTLLNRYGTKALAVRAFADTTQDHPMGSLPGYSTGEMAYICTNENVRHLADLLLRRTAITMEGLLTPEAIHETAKIAANVLGWNKARTKTEIEHAEAELARRSIKNVRTAQAA